MGNWAINIEGVGPHHNRSREEGGAGNENDANIIMDDTLDQLTRSGQTVTHASFTHGARDEK